MPTLHALHIFTVLYETRSVTETAKKFYCSQPSISRCIKDLETEYHTILFERFHHRFIPTDSAVTLYSYAVHILETYTLMNQTMESGKQKLRIGSTVTIANTLLPSFIKQFQEENENVHTEVTVSNGASLNQALLHNQLDIALIENEVNDADLTSIVFSYDSLTLLVPQHHPLTEQASVTLKDLERYPFLEREPGSAVRQYLDQLFEKEHIRIQASWQSRSTHALLYAVEEGLGITILPKKMCETEVQTHCVCALPVQHTSLLRHYYIVHHREKHISEALDSFIHICLG